MRTTLAMVAVAVCVCVSGVARADSAAETHDGFYLRLSLGFGGAALKRDVSATTGIVGFESNNEISGGATFFELGLGGSVADGLVLGGTLLTSTVADPVIVRDDDDMEIDLDSPLHFGLLGVTLDWFPDAQGGWHLGATLGGAWAYSRLPDQPLDFEGLGGTGGGLALHGGYGWWVGDQWSLGVLMRLFGASVAGEDTQSGIRASEDDKYAALAVYFTALLH
jgi:hypothetical protein